MDWVLAHFVSQLKFFNGNGRRTRFGCPRRRNSLILQRKMLFNCMNKALGADFIASSRSLFYVRKAVAKRIH